MDDEPVDERRKSPRARCFSGRLRMKGAVTVHAPWVAKIPKARRSGTHQTFHSCRRIPFLGIGEECSPKSSLWRNSSYSNESEMDKQLTLQQHPRPLPGSDEVRPGTVGTPPGSLRMILMMIPPSTVRPEYVDVPRDSVNSLVSVNGHNINLTKYRRTIYNHFPTEFLPPTFCEDPVWAVLGRLHTFCRACLEQVAATVTHGQDSAQFRQRINKNHVFELGPSFLILIGQ
uniref:Uncharacterized protein n=1 Tax=Anopheles coluzzii TaxID=1518534 RepID=A0A8W7P8E4_ANOCL